MTMLTKSCFNWHILASDEVKTVARVMIILHPEKKDTTMTVWLQVEITK